VKVKGAEPARARGENVSNVTVPIVTSVVIAWTRGGLCSSQPAAETERVPQIAYALFAAVRVAAVVGVTKGSSDDSHGYLPSSFSARRP
jgi:hypothetical protein